MRLYIYLSILLSFLLIPFLIPQSEAQSSSEWFQKQRDKQSELENQLTFPTNIDITVRQGQVVSVQGGARRFSRPVDNIDEILVTKYVGNFECLDTEGENRAYNYVGTHELKTYYFLTERNSLSGKRYSGYAAIAGATDDRDRKLFDTKFVVELCESPLFPQGEVTTLPIEQNILLGALCVGEKEGSSFWADFDYVIYSVENVDSFTVNLTCDNTLTKAKKMARRTADGRHIHRCPEGMHINGTHNTVAYTKKPNPRYCRASELAIKVKKEARETGALDVYEVHCPNGYYVQGTDMHYSISTKRYPPGEYLCYPYRYSWTQKKG